MQWLPSSAIAYLLAMAQSDGATIESGQVAKRLGKTAQQASTTRAHLIREDVIQACGWGKMSFAIPYLAEYLNEHGDELGAESA